MSSSIQITCKFCLSIPKTDKNDEADHKPIAEILAIIIKILFQGQILAQASDWICSKCERKLTAFYEFYNQSLENQHIVSNVVEAHVKLEPGLNYQIRTNLKQEAMEEDVAVSYPVNTNYDGGGGILYPDDLDFQGERISDTDTESETETKRVFDSNLNQIYIVHLPIDHVGKDETEELEEPTQGSEAEEPTQDLEHEEILESVLETEEAEEEQTKNPQPSKQEQAPEDDIPEIIISDSDEADSSKDSSNHKIKRKNSNTPFKKVAIKLQEKTPTNRPTQFLKRFSNKGRTNRGTPHIIVRVKDPEEDPVTLSKMYPFYPNDAIRTNPLYPQDRKSPLKKERSYACSTCNKSFYYTKQLKEHEATHTDWFLNKCMCPYCGNGYTTPGRYMRHIKTMHPDDYKQHQRSYHLKKARGEPALQD